MALFRVRASSGIGIVEGHTEYETTDALRKALEYRDSGLSDIQLIEVESDTSYDIDQFMRTVQ